jgi:hypothetical protein
MQQMKPRGVMTASVISVGPDLGIRELAKLLLDKGSAEFQSLTLAASQLAW